jgi:hypothetical protein
VFFATGNDTSILSRRTFVRAVQDYIDSACWRLSKSPSLHGWHYAVQSALLVILILIVVNNRDRLSLLSRLYFPVLLSTSRLLRGRTSVLAIIVVTGLLGIVLVVFLFDIFFFFVLLIVVVVFGLGLCLALLLGCWQGASVMFWKHSQLEKTHEAPLRLRRSRPLPPRSSTLPTLHIWGGDVSVCCRLCADWRASGQLSGVLLSFDHMEARERRAKSLSTKIAQLCDRVRCYTRLATSFPRLRSNNKARSQELPTTTIHSRKRRPN